MADQVQVIVNSSWWPALTSFMLAAGVLLIGNLIVKGWEKQKWMRDRRENAYLECLKLMAQSTPLPYRDEKGLQIGHRHFLGRMDTLGKVPAWIELLKVYSSAERADHIDKACSILSDSIVKVHDDMRILVPPQYPEDQPEIRIPDHGWTEAFNILLEAIKAGAQEELKEKESRCESVIKQGVDIICQFVETGLDKAKNRLGMH